MMSQEVEEMEMMDRQFNNRGGGNMYSRRMSPMDMYSDPFGGMEEEEDYNFMPKMMHNSRGRGRGGMMGAGGRGMMRPGMGMGPGGSKTIIFITAGSDKVYLSLQSYGYQPTQFLSPYSPTS